MGTGARVGIIMVSALANELVSQAEGKSPSFCVSVTASTKQQDRMTAS
jgi:hypothetical protein